MIRSFRCLFIVLKIQLFSKPFNQSWVWHSGAVMQRAYYTGIYLIYLRTNNLSILFHLIVCLEVKILILLISNSLHYICPCFTDWHSIICLHVTGFPLRGPLMKTQVKYMSDVAVYSTYKTYRYHWGIQHPIGAPTNTPIPSNSPLGCLGVL